MNFIERRLHFAHDISATFVVRAAAWDLARLSSRIRAVRSGPHWEMTPWKTEFLRQRAPEAAGLRIGLPRAAQLQSQIANFGALPLKVTFTFHTEGELTFGGSSTSGASAPNGGLTFMLAPGLRRVTKFPQGCNRSLSPVQVFCKFVSTDTTMLRGAGYVGTDFDLGAIVRAAAAE